jgi:Na+:H+ antiporter
MPLAEILLVTACLLTIAMLLTSLRQQLILPYTVLLVLLGILVDMVAPYFAFAEQLHQFKITPDIVLYLFLPALIFESAISLDARALLKNIAPILVLAIPGMLVSCFLVGSGLWMALNINFLVALILGCHCPYLQLSVIYFDRLISGANNVSNILAAHIDCSYGGPYRQSSRCLSHCTADHA